MPKEFLNDARIRALKSPSSRVDITDAGQRGLRLRLLPDGRCIWSFRYKNSKREPKAFLIGEYNPPNGTIAQARAEAERLRVLVRSGRCPQSEREAERRSAEVLENQIAPPTFADMVDAFLRSEAATWRLKTRTDWGRYLGWAKVAFGKRTPDQVTPDDIRAFIEAITLGTGEVRVSGEVKTWFKAATPIRRPAPVSAKHAFAALRRAYVWGVSQRRAAVSPCDQAKPYRQRQKKIHNAHRIKPYTDAQLRAIMSASVGTSLEYLVRLLLLTGVRAHEAMSARWKPDIDIQEVDGKVDLGRSYWRVPPEMQKVGDFTGKSHVVPLTAPLVALLAKIRERNMADGFAGSPWLFPANTTACAVCGEYGAGHIDRRATQTKKIKDAAGITGFGFLHRFRDTIKTRMSEQGISGSVSEHILGHVIPGIEGIYDHAEQLPARRSALDWWAGELDRIQAGAEVLQLAASSM